MLTPAINSKLQSLLTDYDEKFAILSSGDSSPTELERLGKECDKLGKLAELKSGVETARESLVESKEMIIEEGGGGEEIAEISADEEGSSSMSLLDELRAEEQSLLKVSRTVGILKDGASRLCTTTATLAPPPCVKHSTVRRRFRDEFMVFCKDAKNRHITLQTSNGRIVAR